MLAVLHSEFRTRSNTGRFRRGLQRLDGPGLLPAGRPHHLLESLAMGANEIVIVGAREHNLKDISLTLPRDRFIVITGLSGSGKSSLAFDTIYAEGQRRYVESLSSYARQFLGQMNKPDVDSIEGLSPAISIDQKTTSRNPRSTVGTVTEIYDYLRLLYARIGHPHCWICGRPIEGQSKRADSRPDPGAGAGHAVRDQEPPWCAARRAGTRMSSSIFARRGSPGWRSTGSSTAWTRRHPNWTRTCGTT